MGKPELCWISSKYSKKKKKNKDSKWRKWSKRNPSTFPRKQQWQRNRGDQGGIPCRWRRENIWVAGGSPAGTPPSLAVMKGSSGKRFEGEPSWARTAPQAHRLSTVPAPGQCEPGVQRAGPHHTGCVARATGRTPYGKGVSGVGSSNGTRETRSFLLWLPSTSFLSPLVTLWLNWVVSCCPVSVLGSVRWTELLHHLEHLPSFGWLLVLVWII
jgi:hypothetical protein